MMWFHPLIGVAFVAVFSYDFVTSGDPMRRTSDAIGLLAIGVAVLATPLSLEAGELPVALLVLALFGHVLARVLVSEGELPLTS